MTSKALGILAPTQSGMRIQREENSDFDLSNRCEVLLFDDQNFSSSQKLPPKRNGTMFLETGLEESAEAKRVDLQAKIDLAAFFEEINQIGLRLRKIHKLLLTRQDSDGNVLSVADCDGRSFEDFNNILRCYGQDGYFYSTDIVDSEESNLPRTPELQDEYFDEILRDCVNRFKALTKRIQRFDQSDSNFEQVDEIHHELLWTIQKCYQNETNNRGSYSKKLEAQYKLIIPEIPSDEIKNLCSVSENSSHSLRPSCNENFRNRLIIRRIELFKKKIDDTDLRISDLSELFSSLSQSYDSTEGGEENEIKEETIDCNRLSKSFEIVEIPSSPKLEPKLKIFTEKITCFPKHKLDENAEKIKEVRGSMIQQNKMRRNISCFMTALIPLLLVSVAILYSIRVLQDEKIL